MDGWMDGWVGGWRGRDCAWVLSFLLTYKGVGTSIELVLFSLSVVVERGLVGMCIWGGWYGCRGMACLWDDGE